MNYINELPIVMIRSLLITIIIEVVFALILGIKEKKDIINIIIANIITNPLVVSISLYFNFVYLMKGKIISLIIMELFAFVVEGIIYAKYIKLKKFHPFLLSLILNVASFSIGKVLQFLFNN